jgi:diguanylate cyclase (GGDEF)-like protein/PAS domain S-box-containing protein
MQNTLLDILILGLQVLVFGSIYRTRPSARLRYWIVGWLCVILHFGVLLTNPVSEFWNNFGTAWVLGSLLLGAVFFLLAATRVKLGPARTLLVFSLISGPPLIFIFAGAFGVQNKALFLGLDLLFSLMTIAVARNLWSRYRLVMPVTIVSTVITLAWAAYMVLHGQALESSVAFLTQLYLINAVLYWQDFQRWTLGVLTAVGGLVAWSLVFPCSLAVAAFAPNLHLSPELWNLPKFFVEFGMILTLLEEEVFTASRQREEYRVLFDSNPHPMWIFDRHTLEFLKVNEAAVAHYGYSEAEFLSMTLRDIGPVEELPRLDAHLRSTVTRNISPGWTHIKKDGSRIQADVASHAIQFNGNEARFSLVQDVTERQQLHDQLVHQANHDILTGLPNRLLLRDRLEQTLISAARRQEKAAVICLDLDRFKQINDTYGHHVGDDCLKHLADLLRSRLRAIDTVARSGGEEFAVVLGGLTQAADAGHVAQTLVEAIRQPFELDGYSLELAASLGIAIFPDDGTNSDSLWRAADAAMYRAKNSGGNQYVFVSQEISASASEVNEIEAYIRRALKEDGLELYYQPQYTLAGKLHGFEALLRLKHPRMGFIPPDRFIPIAEESGLIVRMGDWVLEEVARQSAEWKREGLTPVRVALNVSPLQFMRSDFSSQVRHVLSTYGIEPGMLEIEMTETTVMRSLEEIARQMRGLSALGVSFSVDDFGTGYSSLRHLHQLPLTTLKIDRSFIERICEKDGTYSIVQAILSLAHSLGMQVVAEGVEREEQLARLRELGCDLMQGFLWGRPQPAETIPDLMRRAQRTPARSILQNVSAPHS